MGNKIKEITEIVKLITSMIGKFQSVGSMSMEEQQQLVDCCSFGKRTNDIIVYAEEIAQSDIDSLYDDSVRLMKECNELKTLCSTLSMEEFASFSTYGYCQELLKPCKEKWDKQRIATLSLWKEYSLLRNNLDFQDMQDPNFSVKEKVCDDKKTEHDNAKKLTDNLWDDFKDEEQIVIGTSYYDMTFIEMFVKRLYEIAECIVADVDRIRKEGNNG